ncbi:MAG: sigma-70 family RNA polymerase sigma factor [Vicinamibacterales bacterium]
MTVSDRTLSGLTLPVTFDETASAALESEVLGLFDQFERPLLRYVGLFGLDASDAEDVVQEVFLALFRHLRRGGDRRNLAGWLFQVGRNLALKHRRRGRRHGWLAPADPVAEQRYVDPAANPEQRLVDRCQRGRSWRVLQALPERDRQCVLLRAEGWTYRDIAATLDVSLGTVAKAMARAMQRLGHAFEA